MNSPPFKLALISMPWSIFNRPSIQLGALKAFMEKEMQCQVDNYHPYLNIARAIGIDTYRKICLNSWAGEALFSSLLFKETKESSRKLFYSDLPEYRKAPISFDSLTDIIEQACSEWLKTIPFNQYDLIGFSVCFSQLLPSIYMARQLKKENAGPIVFGGSSCTGEIGTSLCKHFPEIDYVIDGEGEKPLLLLCQSIRDDASQAPAQVNIKIPADKGARTGEIEDINTLPYPDYSPYFKEMAKLFPAKPFIPTLPLEFSRGCWWNRCSFCNLNLQWRNYRWKSSQRMTDETAHFVKKHECLNFSFTDNALPLKQADQYFANMAKKQLDLSIFAEIRIIDQPARIELYSKGGLTTVQIGIESLSNSLLQKMNKGTCVIDNIAAMKLCSEYGILVEGNIISEFPTTTIEEIEETLINLEFIMPYRPLTAASFFLGYGSPIYKQWHKFGISSIGVHHKSKKLFPARYHSSLKQLVNSYRGDRTKQHALWQPVLEKIERWQVFHKNRSDQKTAPLQYRDGGTFIIIRQERLLGHPLQHRLKGLSRKIYLFCNTVQTIKAILSNFKGLKEDSLISFITELKQKQLMFSENDRVLSLAIHHYTKKQEHFAPKNATDY